MRNVVLLFFLAWLVSSVHAEPNRLDATVSVPTGSGLVLDAGKSRADYLVFSGEATASGILQIYWAVSWECEQECLPERTLHMNFFPDAQALSRLPSLRENKRVFRPDGMGVGSNARPEIFVAFPEKKIHALLKDVKNIPENFWKYKERFILLSTTLKFSSLTAFKECDAYNFFGLFLDIGGPAKIILDQENILSKLPRFCGPVPYDEIFDVKSKTSRRIEVRSAPDVASSVSYRLKNGSYVLKLRTVDDDWLYIKSVPGNEDPYSSGTAITGYIHKPELILEPVN
ncbi:MAG: SH3 domain-containing protein [Zoogloeaceae bacterium]|jgi:hypothetical protein|nr:SH3 domain-containing protein [Zoogloeaceae bacterium]